MTRRQDYVDALATLDFYEVLSRRNAADAHNLFLETNALNLQIRASMAKLQREMTEKFPKRWYHFWRRT